MRHLKDTLMAAVLVGTSFGCSTAQHQQSSRPDIHDSARVALFTLTHPQDLEINSIKNLIAGDQVPRGILGEFADTCDEEFRKSISKISNDEQRREQAIQLVKKNRQQMHWCFYAKLYRLDEELSKDGTWAARQNVALDAYIFLSPVASAFTQVYQDAFYKKWATTYYSKMNDWVLKLKKSDRKPASTR
jgi:hypothetical protein